MNLQKLLTYKDYFKNYSEQDTHVKVHQEKIEEGHFTMPFFVKEEEMNNFIKDFYDSDLLDKDYRSHLEEKNIQVKAIKDFAVYSKEDLSAILTYIVRADRFSEGFFIKKAKDGSIYQILNHLEKKGV
jgi:hypothetical protein